MSSPLVTFGGSGAVHLHTHGLVEDMAEVVEMINIGESFTIQHDGRGHLLQSLVSTKYYALRLRLGRHWVRGESQVYFLFYEYKRCVTSSLSIISPKI